MKILDKEHRWVLVVGVIIPFVVAGLYYFSLNQHSAADINRLMTIFTVRTENVLDSTFHKTDVLATVVKAQNGNINEDIFNNVVKSVYKQNSGIRGIQYMPDAIVTYSYPIEGNEAVIGKNFLKIPERRKDVLLAIDTKSIALSGPYHLIQGGLGVVARNPIFLNDSNGNEYFWGFSAIILDLPKAIESVGLDELKNDGYDYQLYCINENKERLIIAGNPNLNLSNAIYGDIQVPHHVWTLALVELHPWNNMAKAGLILLLGILLSLIIWQQYRLVHQKQLGIIEKNQFFADISHDMRTPLNGVIGYTELAREASSPEVLRDYLNKLHISGQLLLQLINNTLDFSKLESSQITLKQEPVLIRDLCHTIEVVVKPLAESKHLDFRMEREHAYEGCLEADSLHIRQIFLNLLSNAVKYTHKGGKVEERIIEEEHDDHVDMTIIVRDTGIGISKEFLPKIFDAYAQESRASSPEVVGTGLGLYIVKQIVDLYHGTINVESEVNVGSTFTVKLSLRKFQGKITEAISTEVAVPILQGMKILLFEDNALNTEIMQHILNKYGMIVTTAANGKEGLDIFSQAPVDAYDAIIMDKRMPVMDGVEATKAIRALKRADAVRIPIIALTGDVNDSSIEECLVAGMNAHIGKPVDKRELVRTLIQLLK